MPELNFTPFPNLVTERLFLRQLKVKDANEILILRSDERVNEFVDRPPTTNIEEANIFIQKIEKATSDNKSIYWAIAFKNEDILIGTICIWNISVENNSAEIGYELYPGFQGKGIMNEAISSVLEFAFYTMKLETIAALPHPANERSIILLLKNNFLLDKNYQFTSQEDADGLSVYYLKKDDLKNKLQNYFA